MIFDDRDVELKGDDLSGRRIDLLVCGGIAAVETPKLIRELRRYQADVHVTMTTSAETFISAKSLEWASKNPVTTELSGIAEHITRSDLVAVAPATLNFVSKASLGIADSAALTLFQSALHRLPIVLAPSMHSSLSMNPIYRNNLESLVRFGEITVIDPLVHEGKNKLADPETIVAHVCRKLSRSKIRGVPVFLTMGPTREPIDDVRYLSNRSTGRLGSALADQLFRKGADVFVISGPTEHNPPSYLEVTRVETYQQMKTAISEIICSRQPRIGIFAAAVLDYTVASRTFGKISSREIPAVALRPTEKLIELVDSANIFKVGFKLESGISVDELKERAQRIQAEIVVANLLEDVQEGRHRAFLWVRKSNEWIEVSSRQNLVSALVTTIEENY